MCCTRGLRGPPPTMKIMVSFPRNHHFQISTCTSKMSGNCLQWVPLWVVLASILWFSRGPEIDWNLQGDLEAQRWKKRLRLERVEGCAALKEHHWEEACHWEGLTDHRANGVADHSKRGKAQSETLPVRRGTVADIQIDIDIIHVSTSQQNKFLWA